MAKFGNRTWFVICFFVFKFLNNFTFCQPNCLRGPSAISRFCNFEARRVQPRVLESCDWIWKFSQLASWSGFLSCLFPRLFFLASSWVHALRSTTVCDPVGSSASDGQFSSDCFFSLVVRNCSGETVIFHSVTKVELFTRLHSAVCLFV